MTLKTISVFISVKSLIIGFSLCRINNNVYKDDNYEVADKNNVTIKIIFKINVVFLINILQD